MYRKKLNLKKIPLTLAKTNQSRTRAQVAVFGCMTVILLYEELRILSF
jgi:hypothetical protein